VGVECSIWERSKTGNSAHCDVILNRGEARVRGLTTDASGTKVNEIAVTASSSSTTDNYIVAASPSKVLQRGFAASPDDNRHQILPDDAPQSPKQGTQ
jgi:hypothetical protein